MDLNLGSIRLPINAATKTFAILAKRGAGKTYTAGVMAEEFFRTGIPFVVFDPIDVWWGLRLAANGKDKGLPVVVFGIEHADIKLDRDMGRRIAQAVVKDNISCVISTFGLPKVAMRQLIADFSEELLNINNIPRHVFIEEAHEFVPQRVMGAMAKTFAAVEALVVMGRNRGIGVTLINQRAATINKDVLTQLDTLLAFQNTSPQDRKALREWVEHHAAEGDFDKFMASLPSLPKGKGWIWSPEFMGVFERVEIRKRETFHPDREKIGDKFVMPQLDQIDIQSFITKFAAEDVRPEPKSGSKPRVAAQAVAPVAPSIDHQAIINLRNDYESRLIEKDTELRRHAAIIDAVRSAVGATSGVTSATPAMGSAVSLWKSKLGNGLAGRIFALFVENAGMDFTRQQIALGVGSSARSGHFDNEMGRLTRNSLVTRNGQLYRLNPDL
jgi:hypothetical protein